MDSRTICLSLFLIFSLFLISNVIAFPVWEARQKFGIDFGNLDSTSGRYHLKIRALDLEGEDQLLNFSMYKNGKMLNTMEIDGNGTMISDNSTVDLEFDYDDYNFIVFIRNLDLVRINSTESNITVGDALPDIDGIDVYTAYKVELPSNFNFTNIDLEIKYKDLPVEYESNLVLKKCSNYNMTSQTCIGNWQNVPFGLNTGNKTVIATINGFSVYALGENTTAPPTTTTIQPTTTVQPTTTTQPQSSGGSGDSGGSSGGSYTPPTTTIRPTTTTTTVPPTTAVSSTTTSNVTQNTTTTTQTANPFTGFASYISSNVFIVSVVIATAMVGVFVWKYWLNKPLQMKISYPRGKIKKQKRNHSYGETRLVLS